MIFKLRDPYEWRRVFALVPRFLDDGDRIVWLQFVERRRRRRNYLMSVPEYEYRLPEAAE